jgi:hypothetical protein
MQFSERADSRAQIEVHLKGAIFPYASGKMVLVSQRVINELLTPGLKRLGVRGALTDTPLSATSGYLAQGTVNVVPDGITISGGSAELDPIYQAALAYALGIANGGRQQLVEVCKAIARAKAGDAKSQKFVNYLPAAFRAVKQNRGAVAGALADSIKRRARPAPVRAAASAAQSVLHAGRRAMQARAMSL